MIEFVVDTDSCAQLAAYLNRGPLQAPHMTASPKNLTMNELLDNMAVMAMVGYNKDEIIELVDKLENLPLDRLVELYPPAAADEESDCTGNCTGNCTGECWPDPEDNDDEPDPVSDETIEDIVTVVLNNDERVEVLEEELERYRKELADVRGVVLGLGKRTAINTGSLQKEVDDLRVEVKNLQQIITDVSAVTTEAAGTSAVYRFEYNID